MASSGTLVSGRCGVLLPAQAREFLVAEGTPPGRADPAAFWAILDKVPQRPPLAGDE